MGILDFFRKRAERRRLVAAAGVEFDDERVVHRRRDGSVETMVWSELVEVGILTTSDGPFGEDVYWMLLAADRKSGCAVPGSAVGMDRLLSRLQELPGFDNRQVIEAMGSVADARFVCWTKPG
jgi:hypothetical protein